jgi:hypothetical protein
MRFDMDLHNFWSNDSTWPKVAPNGYIFLGEAFKQAAISLLEKSWMGPWQGDEPYLKIVPVLQENRALVNNSHFDDFWHVHEAIYCSEMQQAKEDERIEIERSYRVRKITFQEFITSPEKRDEKYCFAKYFNDETWGNIARISKRLCLESVASNKRFNEVKIYLSNAIGHKQISFIIVNGGNGELICGINNWFFSNFVDSYYTSCQINRHVDSTFNKTSPNATLYIYLNQAEFEDWLSIKRAEIEAREADWKAGEGEKFKPWLRRSEVEFEAKRRARLVSPTIQDTDIYSALGTMWEECGNAPKAIQVIKTTYSQVKGETRDSGINR